MAQKQQQQAMEGLRTRSDRTKTNMFTLRKGVRDVLILFYGLSFINVVVYNTGWLPWTGTDLDVIWSTIVGSASVVGPIMLKVLDK